MTNDSLAVVTGASTGIGAATVRALRNEGRRVLATARRRSRLAELAAETGCETEVADLTVADDVDRLAARARSLGPVGALVNNAGGARGLDPVATGSVADWEEMYRINVVATLRVTQALLPALEDDGGGDLLFVTSTAAIGSYPGGAGYTAAKSAEREIALTLRQELVGRPVRILEIAPGLVQTEEFSLRRFDGDADRAAAVYQGVVGGPLVAEDIAEAIAWMLARPRHVNIDHLVIRPTAQATHTLMARE